jgi:hypothetical protein
MPIIKIPIPALFSQSTDESSLPDQVGARLINGYLEKLGDTSIVRKAPGLITVNNLFDEQGWTSQHGIDGCFWWDDNGMVIVVANGRFYKKISRSGAFIDITGDSLSVIGPVTFATNGWCLLAASGGRIVTWRLYNNLVTYPSLTIGTQKDRLSVSAFTYSIQGTEYSKSGTDNISPGTDTIPKAKFGAISLDIDYAGTFTVVPASNNSTGYDNVGLTIGTNKDQLKIGAFTYYIDGIPYSMPATDNISPGTDTIPDGTYGAVALEVNAAGVLSTVSALKNTTTGYASAALAIADIPVPVSSQCRLGWVTAKKMFDSFIFDTTLFDAIPVTASFTSNYLSLGDIPSCDVDKVRVGTVQVNNKNTYTDSPPLLTLGTNKAKLKIGQVPFRINEYYISLWWNYYNSVLNPGFETAGGGGADVFANWVENAGSGSIVRYSADPAKVYSGTYSCLMTAGSSVDTYIYQDISVSPLEVLFLSFQHYGTGSVGNPGYYKIYDVTHGADIVSKTSCSYAQSWGAVGGYFTIPAGCVSIRLYLYPPEGSGWSSYFDEFSIYRADNLSVGTDVIPINKYGCVAIDVAADGGTTAVSATGNATGYNSAALAVAGLPYPAANKCRFGWVTVMKSDGSFTFGTTEFDAANITEEYTDNPFTFTFDTSNFDNPQTAVVYTDGIIAENEKTIFLKDPDAPMEVSHVSYIDGYILANEVGTSRFWWSDADTVANWGAISFASAEGHPDKLVALRVANMEIALLGKASFEVFYDDGVSPFSRLQGAYIERGCLAPYSLVNATGVWVFLDHERRVVMMDGRNPVVVSGPYDDVIRDIDKVSDAYASYFTIGINSFYVISFPSVERTFVLNLTTKSWSEWGDWVAPNYKLWKGKSYCYATDWEMHLIGDNANGNIYEIRGDFFKQGPDNIRTLMISGQISHGSYEPKISEELILRMKRGTGAPIVPESDQGTDIEEPLVSLRWRNEDQIWKPEKIISLGKAGDVNIIKRIFRLGVYRTRQYEFVHSSPSDFILSDMEERVLQIGSPDAGGS